MNPVSAKKAACLDIDELRMYNKSVKITKER